MTDCMVLTPFLTKLQLKCGGRSFYLYFPVASHTSTHLNILSAIGDTLLTIQKKICTVKQEVSLVDLELSTL